MSQKLFHLSPLVEGTKKIGKNQSYKLGAYGTDAKSDDLRNFLRGMSGSSKPLARSLATIFPWQKYQTFVDIGTAQGECPIQLALAHKHLTGYGLDLPAVQPYFEEYVSQFELQDRLHFVAGSFLK